MVPSSCESTIVSRQKIEVTREEHFLRPKFLVCPVPPKIISFICSACALQRGHVLSQSG